VWTCAFQNMLLLAQVQSIVSKFPEVRSFPTGRSKFPDRSKARPTVAPVAHVRCRATSTSEHPTPPTQECWLSSFSLSGLWPLLLRSRAFPFTMPLMLVSRCPPLASVPGCGVAHSLTPTHVQSPLSVSLICEDLVCASSHAVGARCLCWLTSESAIGTGVRSRSLTHPHTCAVSPLSQSHL
jgi:hypothetical protein